MNSHGQYYPYVRIIDASNFSSSEYYTARKKFIERKALSEREFDVFLLVEHERQHHADLTSSNFGIFLWQLQKVINNDLAYLFRNNRELFYAIDKLHKVNPELKQQFLKNRNNTQWYTFYNVCQLYELESILFCPFPSYVYKDLTYGELKDLINSSFQYLGVRLGIEHKITFSSEIPQEKVFPSNYGFNYRTLLETSTFLHELSLLRGSHRYDKQVDKCLYEFSRGSYAPFYELLKNFFNKQNEEITTFFPKLIIENLLNQNWIIGSPPIKQDIVNKDIYYRPIVENLMPAQTIKKEFTLRQDPIIGPSYFLNNAFFALLRQTIPTFTDESNFFRLNLSVLNDEETAKSELFLFCLSFMCPNRFLHVVKNNLKQKSDVSMRHTAELKKMISEANNEQAIFLTLNDKSIYNYNKEVGYLNRQARDSGLSIEFSDRFILDNSLPESDSILGNFEAPIPKNLFTLLESLAKEPVFNLCSNKLYFAVNNLFHSMKKAPNFDQHSYIEDFIQNLSNKIYWPDITYEESKYLETLLRALKFTLHGITGVETE